MRRILNFKNSLAGNNLFVPKVTGILTPKTMDSRAFSGSSYINKSNTQKKAR
jgi:hypothetical protein